jgi:hypothetical protein
VDVVVFSEKCRFKDVYCVRAIETATMILRASVRRHRRAQGDRSTLRSIRPKRAMVTWARHQASSSTGATALVLPSSATSISSSLVKIHAMTGRSRRFGSSPCLT